MRQLCIFFIAAIAFVPVHAEAETAPGRSAEQLFQDARALLQQEEYARACPMLEESYRLEVAIGTALNLALCHYKLERWALAYEWYERAATLAGERGDEARAAFARREMSRLDTSVGHLHVRWIAPVADLQLYVDGLPVTTRGVFHLSLGGHIVLVRAAGYRHWEKRFELRAGESFELKIPAMVPVPVVRALGEGRLPERRSTERARLRLWAFGTAGAGVAVVGVGLVFGSFARSSHDEAIQLCGAELMCSPSDFARGRQLTDEANDRARLSTVAISAGLLSVAVGVGMYWRWRAPRDGGKLRSPARLAPLVGKRDGGVMLTGGF